MDKNAIKKFAVWARRELIARVSQKAEQFGITEEYHGDAYAERIGEQLLTRTEQNQRKNLITRIEQEGYKQVMEEVAYTWFNRFIALRFMEVNGYLPTRIRVFTDEENVFKPQILTEAIHMETDGLDMEKVYAFKEKNQTEELFKYLIITQCNALSSILPGMFQTISDYTELLFPDNLLREGSVIQQMIELIPEEDWQDQVQIIGWLYQYYNTEPKDQVFANLKKNIKISKHDIPAATQLFTPDWIVRYMVENSLGRLWVEGHPDEALQSTWKYYLPEAEQEPQVQAQLSEIRKEYANIKPEDIRCIDPCMGSGHILCYLFDVLMQIYEAYGYSTREAAQSIVENNLYGLDIDDRAAQLAYFAVMMKARQYDRRFFTRGIQPHVMAIQESNTLEAFDHLQRQLSLDTLCLETANQLIHTFRDAKEYGSILDVEIPELDTADRLMEQIRAINGDFELMAWIAEAEALLPVLAKQASIMQQKYDIVVTNPPYMSSGGMSAKLSRYIKNNFADEKADIYACVMKHSLSKTKRNGFIAMITMESWMFLPVFETFRKGLLKQITVDSLVHMPYLGKGGTSLGIAFGTSAFSFRNISGTSFSANYQCIRYYETDDDGVPFAFPTVNERQTTRTIADFSAIRSTPVAYWASSNVFRNFATLQPLENYIDARSGISTGDNDRFYRFWYECPEVEIAFDYRDTPENSKYKWFPIIRGGDFRRWYGNMDNVINLQNSGWEIQNSGNNFRLRTPAFYNRRGITWNRISSRAVSFRLKTEQVNFGENSPCMFVPTEMIQAMMGMLNSKVAKYFLEFINSTMTFQVLDIQMIPYYPYADEKITECVDRCIRESKSEWDSFEISWDFNGHPLVKNASALWDCTSVACTLAGIGVQPSKEYPPIALSYLLWKAECEERFKLIKANEERINGILINLYGLQNELNPDVLDMDVTVRKADLGRDIRSLISYAVGCMFGRYSLDIPGLILAGQPFKSRFAHNPMGVAYGDPCQLEGDFISRTENSDDYVRCTFAPDKDGILPISDDEYFADDIVGKFVKFIEVVYGEETLEANLKFIADALGGKGSPREVIRSYFLNDFYADHLKIYQKRPIYWLFDSGKKNGFKCLVYMHRYAPDTIARIRTDYVHEQQSRYRTAIHDLEKRIAAASTGERVKLTKQLTKLRDQAEEARVYEEKIHHYADQMIAIDLDDGVKVNYAKFDAVLAKIK